MVPAYASAATLCVGTSGGSCTTTEATLTAAMAAAASGDTVELGAGTFTASSGVDGAVSTQPHITLVGAGPGGSSGTTISGLSTSAFNLSLSGTGSSASNLEVLIPSGSTGKTGADVNGAVTNVAVVGASGASNSEGVIVGNGDSFSGSVDLSAEGGSSKVGIALGAGTVSKSTVTGAQDGIEVGSGNGSVATIAATRITGATSEDVEMTDGGTLNLVDSLLELGTPCGGGCAGVYVTDGSVLSGESDLAKIDQDTFVAGTTSGGASAGWAVTVAGHGSSQSATAEIDSSVGVGFLAAGVGAGGNVECYETSGGSSAVSIGYSSFNFTGMTGSSGSITPACPAPTLTSNQNQGGSSPVLPGFVNAAAGDYHLTYNSPLIDAGDPTLTAGTDFDGKPRVVNGKGTSGPAVTDIGAYEYQRAAPTVTATGPSTATPGQALAFSGTAADPNAGESITSYAWKFDDGASATGATATHAYAAAGTHHATLTVTEPNGVSASATVTTVVALSMMQAPAAPVISATIFIKTRTTGNGKHRHTTPNEIRLNLSAAATVTFTLERTVIGRKHGHSCVAATRARRHLPKCTRELPAGKITSALPAGTDLLVLKHKLRAGRYVATIVALSSSGQPATPVLLKFRVR